MIAENLIQNYRPIKLMSSRQELLFILGVKVSGFPIKEPEESVTLSGSLSVGSEYPSKIMYVGDKTPTGLIKNSDFSYAKTPGSKCSLIDDMFGVIKFSDSFLNKLEEGETLHGVCEFKYTAFTPHKWKVFIYKPGLHYFQGTNKKTGQVDIFTIEYLEPAAQTLEVRDYCTDEPIANANVNVAGNAFVTDANGYIVLGKYSPGQTLPVLITATGYHDSDVDTLNNDEITT